MKSYKNNSTLLGLIAVSSLSLTACESFHLGPKLGMKIPIEKRAAEDYIKPENEEQTKDSKFAQLGNEEDEESSKQSLKKKIFEGTGEFSSEKKEPASSNFGEGGKYSLNFDGADLGEVAKIILTDMLQENYVMSPKVGGTVTLQTTKPLHEVELLPTLEMLLRVNGAVLIKREGLYRIEANADSLQAASASGTKSSHIQAGYQIKIIPLQYVGATDMAEVITPVLPAKSIVKIDPARNLLLVAGTQTELRKVLELVKTFDVNFIEGMSYGLFPLENTDIENTLEQVEQVFNKGEKNPLSGMLRFVSIKHLNAILVITKQKDYLKEAEKWITMLDKDSEGVGEGGVVVYKVQHVDAEELADTLSQVVSGIASPKSKASVAPGEKIASITNKRRKPAKRINSKKSGEGTGALEGVSIIADAANNALIITAQPQQYRMLHKIIKQVDVMPLQVLLEATIISVGLTDTLTNGIRWYFENAITSKNASQGGYTGIGGLGQAGEKLANAALSAAAGGFSYGIIDNGTGVRMALDLMAEDKNTNIISSPSVMVLNNKEAIFKVGDEVPSTSGISESTGGNFQSQRERLETGISLTITPRVNANGVVIMDIEQEFNKVVGSPQGSSITDSPTILKREITSSVAVVDGESVVLGGLISEDQSKKVTGIPFLKDIPYLGWLFGSTERTKEKNELIVIISPKVIADKYDARKVTDNYKRKLSGIFYNEGEYDLKWNEEERDYSGRLIDKDKIDAHQDYMKDHPLPKGKMEKRKRIYH